MSFDWICCLVLTTLSVALVESSDGVKRYDGYTVFRLIPRTQTQLNYLRALEENVVEVCLD